ncbi:MAG TPA: hypothetical protein VNH22_03005 [Blastocatellia bacterium]|nr:hypothetical protein [Blastocatellia bacterium]
MRNQRTRLTHSARSLAAAVFWSIAMASASLALQSGTPMGPPPGGPNLKAETRNRELRESVLRNMDLGPAGEKRNQKRIDEAVEQVRQDFRQIQIVRNELVRNLLAEKPLDFKVISNRVGEINKLAGRLKIYLLPPTPEDKDKAKKNPVELNDGEIKGALIQLCNQIVRFTDNPVLKAPGTVDVEQSSKAGGDLLGIIELSNNIKRSAERLNHPSK